MKRDVAVAIIINQNNEILCLQRSETSKSWQGYWNFPGGGVEPGERPELAAQRELQEEAGITTELEDLYKLGYTETKHLNINFYIANRYSGQVKINNESSNFAWADINMITKMKFIPLNRELLSSIQAFIDDMDGK